MKKELLDRLRCPKSDQLLRLDVGARDETCDAYLVSADGLCRYPIRNGIPRFVPASNYADSFGLQWNKFARTQLDSFSGHSISADRFWSATGWDAANMAGKWILDAGCGSGRFAEIALSTGAQVVALDYSNAVDACKENLGHHANLHVVQGDIYSLPFAPESFDFVYSLGVLQHTPNVERAFSALPRMVTGGGGSLCVDYYEKSIRSRLLPKYWLRPFTKRMNKRRLFASLQLAVPILLPISRSLARIPILGDQLKRLVPVANYEGILPLSPAQLKEWAILDTFDWLSPVYDNPQTAETVRLWFERAGLDSIEVVKAGHLVGRGRKV
jgi:SAM-dependent methyltransferase/uncharacterized protein YbaR (Trm112 family)